MNSAFRLILSVVLVGCFAGLVAAHGVDERIEISDFARNPEAFAGRVVEVRGRVVAINANGKSLELFDPETRTSIAVQLAQLSKAERKALIRGDVRDVVVSGRADVVRGRLVIEAQRVDPQPAACELKVE
jgi:hypothetical protein